MAAMVTPLKISRESRRPGLEGKRLPAGDAVLAGDKVVAMVPDCNTVFGRGDEAVVLFPGGQEFGRLRAYSSATFVCSVWAMASASISEGKRIGSPKRTEMACGGAMCLPAALKRYKPSMRIGTIGRLSRCASNPMPLRNGLIAPSVVRLPSGNTTML